MSQLSLTPLKTPGKNEAFSVLDIEATKWINFLTIGVYDGDTFIHFEKLDLFIHYIIHRSDHDSIPIRRYYAHFGGIYDFLFLLDAFLRHPDLSVSAITPRGSGILSFTVRTARNRIVFYDSSALFPFSLKKLTHSFGVTHRKMEIDHSKVTRVTPQLLKYLKYDCIGLYESLKKFFKTPIIQDAGAAATLAGQALKVYRRRYLDRPIESLSVSCDHFMRRAYAGGRTEIFKPLFEGKRSAHLHCYDVNSLYPFVMADYEFPGSCEEVTNEKLDLSKMGFIEGEVLVPEGTYLPLLWTRENQTFKKFIFPTGRFKGVWSTLELKEAIELGAKLTDFKQAYYFTNIGPIFKKYVEDLYQMRLDSKDEVQSIIAKLLLNSLYGRFGINREREKLVIDQGQQGIIPYLQLKSGIRIAKKPIDLKIFSNVAIAAWVTALARIHMHRIMRKCEKTLYYTDTDSLFTTEELPTGSGIGKLKLEYSTRQACFLLPKTYYTDHKIVMKGFDKKKITHFKFEDFQDSLEGEIRLQIKEEDKPFRLKGAMRRGKLLLIKKGADKRIKSLYDKRVLIKTQNGWDSRPIHLN